jgi:hypothetical protein
MKGDVNVVANSSDGSSLQDTPQKGIDFLNDDKKEQTWGRRIALSLIDNKWYNPRAGQEEEDDAAQVGTPNSHRSPFHSDKETSLQKPSLEKAWAYFEHVSMYRYILEEKPNQTKKNLLMRAIGKFQNGDKKLEKAEPGERDFKTKLYDPIFTPHTQVKEKRTKQ